MSISTGYFANTKKFTKVHLVKGGKPVCGSVISENKSYQWCSNFIKMDYLECEKCKIIGAKINLLISK